MPAITGAVRASSLAHPPRPCSPPPPCLWTSPTQRTSQALQSPTRPVASRDAVAIPGPQARKRGASPHPPVGLVRHTATPSGLRKSEGSYRASRSPRRPAVRQSQRQIPGTHLKAAASQTSNPAPPNAPDFAGGKGLHAIFTEFDGSISLETRVTLQDPGLLAVHRTGAD